MSLSTIAIWQWVFLKLNPPTVQLLCQIELAVSSSLTKNPNPRQVLGSSIQLNMISM
ncbi:hypothetical protein F442_10479 [Phytophthora nicotianae P10297]|uniref:Uncharacterized protein n=1 Tax=Phytophthora nicotianae P10297 TaxID=1317064 RepID=W2Z6N2_PHYNI|nr:hypothetical protein F442_10479 [Phytophthora nicotianae P10297]